MPTAFLIDAVILYFRIISVRRIIFVRSWSPIDESSLPWNAHLVDFRPVARW